MKKLDKYTLGFIVVVALHVFVLLKSTFFPYPELFIYPYLTNIGLTPYAQILDQHFPGFMFFPLNIASIGFNTPFGFRILQIGVIIGVQTLIFESAKKTFKSTKTAFLTSLLFLIVHPFFEGNVLWIDSFMPFVLLPSFYLLSQKLDNRRSFLVGMFMGLAVLLKQVAVPLAVLVAIYMFLYRKKQKTFSAFFLGATLPALALLLFVIKNNIFEDFLFWAGTFNLTTYAEMGRKYATFRQLLAAGVVYMPAILISLQGLRSKKRHLPLLSIFFLTSLLYAYARFDYVHLQPSLPFAILLLASFWSTLPKKIASILFIIYLIPVIWVSSKYYINNIGDGVRFFGDTEYKVAEKILTYSEKGDSIFMFGTLPHMYQMTSTRPPNDIFVFQFPWFMVEAEERVLFGIKSDPPKVVVQERTSSIDGESLYSYMKNIDEYISQNYEKIDQVGDLEILIPIK